MGAAYSKGFVAITLEWGAILIGFNALLWIFLPFYIRNGFYTVPEYLEKRFGGATRVLYAILILFTYIFVEIGAVLYLGGLTLHALFDIPIFYSIIGMAVLTGLYTVLGGLKAVIWTEMVQLGVLVLGGLVLTFATINKAGGFDAIVESSKNWKMRSDLFLENSIHLIRLGYQKSISKLPNPNRDLRMRLIANRFSGIQLAPQAVFHHPVFASFKFSRDFGYRWQLFIRYGYLYFYLFKNSAWHNLLFSK